MNANAHCIRFDSDGTATALWTESIPLAEIGSLQVQRASTIEYNNLIGCWEVRIKGELKLAHLSRDYCLKWEHDHFNELIASGKR